jgi:hypothetical protein
MAAMAQALNPPTAPQPPADLQVLAAWAPELADTFVALSCDIALVIDAAGRIVKLAQHDSHPIAPPAWVGSAWTATVGDDSTLKVEQLLAEVLALGQARRREVNHPGAIGGAAAVAYSAVRLGEQGPTLAIGHDLRAQSALQQRFLAAQEALERSYWNAHQPAREEAPALMTESERQSLGLASSGAASDAELLRALDRLYERIGHDKLPGLLRDARRLTERHFLARAMQRAGGDAALVKSVAGARRTLARRKKKT